MEDILKFRKRIITYICFTIIISFITSAIVFRFKLLYQVVIECIILSSLLFFVSLDSIVGPKASIITLYKWKRFDMLKIIFIEFSLTKFPFWAIYNIIKNKEINMTTIFLFYLTIFCLYHNGEFFFVLFCHPKEIHWDSKIINNTRFFNLSFSQLYFSYEFCNS